MGFLSFCLTASGTAGRGEREGRCGGDRVAVATTSDLGKWEEKTELADFSGSGYLEFLGQHAQASGPATSPLTYKFVIERGGLYYLHLKCAREMVKGAK